MIVIDSNDLFFLSRDDSTGPVELPETELSSYIPVIVHVASE